MSATCIDYEGLTFVVEGEWHGASRPSFDDPGESAWFEPVKMRLWNTGDKEIDMSWMLDPKYTISEPLYEQTLYERISDLCTESYEESIQ